MTKIIGFRYSKRQALLWLANPPAAGIEFSRALVSACGEMGSARSPEAAADVLRNTAIKIRG